VDAERTLERFRSAVRADIARGGAKPLRSYLRMFGVQFADEITREYAALMTDSPGLSLGDGPRADPAVAPTPAPPDATASIGLAPLGAPLVEKEEIARGGMGAIVRVRDESLQRDLAMKVVLAGDAAPSRESLLRFVDEARVQARLDHPGVVPIHHLGTDAAGRVCFTMKLVAGRSLAEILADQRRDDLRGAPVKIVQTLLRVCETVAFAHDKGVVHRDLKPANVMVGAFGEVYVMDWGLAKTLGAADRVVGDAAPSSSASSSGLTQAGAVLGTPTYMPPEQAEGKNDEVDARSDVYAIGAILYEALAGRAPYQTPDAPRSAVETLRDVLAGPPAPLARFAPRGVEELVAVAEKAMSRRREDRYASAGELGEDLQRWIEGRVVRAYRTGAWAEFTKWVRRNKAVAASLVVVAGVVVAASAAYVVLEKDANRRIAKQRDDAVAARNDEASARRDAVAAKDDAVKARDDAVAAARRADGLRLCTIATTKADEDATLASLLAFEGVRLAPGVESTSALFTALRGFGEARTLVAHGGGVQHCLWSPDGRRAYTAGRFGRVISWDPATGRELRRVAMGRYDIVDLQLADGGKKLFAAALFEPARLLDAETFATLREFPVAPSAALLGRYDAALSPDGSRLAVADHDGAHVFDVATGRETARFAGHELLTTSVRWSPDGKRVASGGADLHVRIWDAADGRQIADVPPTVKRQPPTVAPQNPAAVADACPTATWSADGTRVVAFWPRATEKSRVAVYDAATGARVFVGDPSAPWSDFVGMSPDGRRAIVNESLGAEGRRQSFVDLATGAVSPVPWDEGKGAEWRRPAFSKDGRLVALTSAVVDRFAVAVWSTETGARLRTCVGHAATIGEIAFDPDGVRLITCSADERAAIWEIKSDAFRAGVALRTTPTSVPDVRSMDASGRVVAVSWKHPGADAPASAEVADAAGGAVLLAFADPADVRDMSLSRDGARVAVQRAAGARQRLEVLEVATGRALAAVDGNWIQEVRFDGTGRRLAFRAKEVSGASFEDAAFVLDVDSGAPPRRFDNPDAAAASMKFEQLALSADGALLAASQGYVGAIVWEVATGRIVNHYAGHTGLVMNVAFSPDGARLASSSMDTSVQVHDVASGAGVATYTGLPHKRTALAFSPDGAVIAAVSPDVIQLFDARKSGKEIGRIPRPDPQFTFRAAIGADGRIVAAMRDGTTRSWPLDPAAWFAERHPRELTVIETQLYGVGDANERIDRELRRVLSQTRIADLVGESAALLAVGRTADAERCVRRAEELDPEDYLTPVAAARLAAARGDVDAALAAMRRARDLGETPARYAGDPSLAAVRADPRWRALVEDK
jgi:WD40 repeat protein